MLTLRAKGIDPDVLGQPRVRSPPSTATVVDKLAGSQPISSISPGFFIAFGLLKELRLHGYFVPAPGWLLLQRQRRCNPAGLTRGERRAHDAQRCACHLIAIGGAAGRK